MCVTESATESDTRQSPADTFTVSIIMERREIARHGWSVPQWQLIGVVPDHSPVLESPESGVKIHQSEQSARYLWSGFAFELYRDSAEQYWHTLIGNEPAIYVICREDEERELTPHLVTIDYDEAGAYVEADDKVFSQPIPQEVYQALEEFVLTHYQPEEKKVRKRKKWKRSEGGDEAFAYRPKI